MTLQANVDAKRWTQDGLTVKHTKDCTSHPEHARNHIKIHSMSPGKGVIFNTKHAGPHRQRRLDVTHQARHALHTKNTTLHTHNT